MRDYAGRQLEELAAMLREGAETQKRTLGETAIRSDEK
jgi:hypothetical protein